MSLSDVSDSMSQTSDTKDRYIDFLEFTACFNVRVIFKHETC